MRLKARGVSMPEKDVVNHRSWTQTRAAGVENEAAEDDAASENSTATSEDVELDPLVSESSGSDAEITGLNRLNRGRKNKARHRTTDLEVPINGNASIHIVAKRLADRTLIKSILMNSILVLLWYTFSISISMYNKWMFAKDYLDFHFPLFTTCLHMLVQFLLALLVLAVLPGLRPRSRTSPSSSKKPISMKEAFFSEDSGMSLRVYLSQIAPCGTATGLDIGLGNMSLKFITLTFYTMCKSSSLAFVLIFAFLFRLESPSLKLIAVIATMTIGVIMMVAGEVDFDMLGFVLVILAAFFSGFRWSLTQILLLRSPATSNPFSSILFLAPVMFLSLALIAIPVEGPFQLASGLQGLLEDKGIFFGVGILLFPGLLAFLMTASEFALLQRTSVVTLSICGIFKEVVTISAAGLFFHDPLTPINVSGLLVTIASIACYNYIKITALRRRKTADIEHPGHGESGALAEGTIESQPAQEQTTASARNSITPSNDAERRDTHSKRIAES